MRWTNDVYVSTPHRVVNRSAKERYSIAFFYDPNPDAMVETIPSCVREGEAVRYPPILAARLSEDASRCEQAGHDSSGWRLTGFDRLRQRAHPTWRRRAEAASFVVKTYYICDYVGYARQRVTRKSGHNPFNRRKRTQSDVPAADVPKARPRPPIPSVNPLQKSRVCP